jgi:hypothetical protein
MSPANANDANSRLRDDARLDERPNWVAKQKPAALAQKSLERLFP